MRILLLAVVLFLAGCTTPISHVYTEGWPKLAITEHYVSTKQMRDECAKYIAFGSYALACAEFNLPNRTCDIWVSYDYADADVLSHEILHCQGYDHPGGTYLKDMLSGYKASIR